MNWKAKWQQLTPGQRLWIEVFGIYGLPKLDERKVLAIIDQLTRRQARVIRLRFGFSGIPLTYDDIGRQLPRIDGELGVSRETARLELKKAIRHLRSPKWRREWDEAKK